MTHPLRLVMTTYWGEVLVRAYSVRSSFHNQSYLRSRPTNIVHDLGSCGE